eukprot:8496091-Pyramimonas_sp.AAC.1
MCVLSFSHAADRPADSHTGMGGGRACARASARVDAGTDGPPMPEYPAPRKRRHYVLKLPSPPLYPQACISRT